MCGFAGQVAFSGLQPDAAKRRLDRALERLAPRGPDGDGIWTDENAILGHRRLAIVDLSDSGAQPMVRGGLALVFNGMIYNYRTLRDELAGHGHHFDSDCDTEVLLAGWKQWGADLLPRLLGMFALAIWDSAARRLTLARDRMGKKPLCYRADDNGAVFASDLRALQFMEGRAGSVDPVSRRLYFSLRFVPEPRTILAGVHKVPPGAFVTIDDRGAAIRHWYVPAQERPPLADAGAASPARRLRQLIEQAVADRLVADVPVGAFLSGGIDSAIVSACMARGGSAVRTFTVGFEGVADYYEERPAARRVAEYLGTKHVEIPVTADETLSVIDEVFDGLDEPFADSSAIPTYLVSRETRRHVTVALSGDGADEVFGGYRKYQGELLAARYHAIPGFLRRGLIEPLARVLPEGKQGRLLEAFRRARRFVAHAGGDGAARQSGWMRLLPEGDLERLCGPVPAADTLDALVGAARAAANTADPINAMLAADMSIGLPGDMLTKVDRMSMANGLEVRCPMLDHRVVAFARSLAGPAKLQRGRGKAVLRDAFADMLPAEVFERPKKGFEVPVATWLTGPLAALADAAVDPERMDRHGLGAPDLAAGWQTALASGRRDTSAELWTLIAYHAWCDRQAALGLPE